MKNTRYSKKPEMIFFDVGGTLFEDTKCIPRKGLTELKKYARDSYQADDEHLSALWDEYMDEVDVGLRSKNGAQLDIPLSAILKYITMNAGLHFDISMPVQEEIFDRFNSGRKVKNGIEELLCVLKKEGIRTAVISNNGMSGESLMLATKRWLPSSCFEFCFSSADILLAKPHKSIFLSAASFAGVLPENCWYCGDSFVPDIEGAGSVGMCPVLINEKSDIPLCFEKNADKGEYMVINSWGSLTKYISEMK